MRTVNINREKADHYCGRPSVYSNPYHIGPDGDRTTVLRLYYIHLVDNPEIVKIAYDTFRDGDRLGCYCAPDRCHVDILRKFVRHFPAVPAYDSLWR